MSLRLSPKKRLEKIKELLPENTSWKDIAAACHCHRFTVYKDFKKWRLTEDFKNWIAEQYMRLYGTVSKEDPVAAFREISRLLAKTMTEKREIEGQVTVTLKGYGIGDKQPKSDS